jgi:hypothetical protein
LNRITRFAAFPLAAFLLAACAGMNMKRSEQGIMGTFTTYGPPYQIADCEPLRTQAEKDSCKRDNERVIVEPYRSEILIRNLGTREKLSLVLDEQGSYRVLLQPGQYEVCVNLECSDPLEVRVGKFTTYGQRLPRAASGSGKAAKP